MEPFNSAYGLVRKLEGGLVDNPQDPGGKTMAGITQKTYDAYCLKHNAPTKDVATLTEDEIRTFYFDYWHQYRCDLLTNDIAIAFFQFAVNAGTNATKEIQKRYKLNVDGVIGSDTVNALNLHSFYNDILAFQISYYTELENFKVFGLAWIKRVLDTVHYIIAQQQT